MSGADQLIEKARSRTGLRDFGDDSFREGLEVLVNAIETEPHHGPIRVEAFLAQLVRYLCSRLEIEDWYRRYPEIDDEPIVAPLFGLGLPRTGSTVFASLLSQDPELRTLRYWEAAKPCPPPQTATQHTDPRIETACIVRQKVERRAPRFKTMLPWSADGPVECIELLALDFKSYVFQLFLHCPSYHDWYLNCDMIPAYRYHKRALKLLQWRCPPRRWQLKSPTHIFSINALSQVYPDARFWMTHRDPAHAIPSIASLELELQKLYCDEAAANYGVYSANCWAVGMERIISFRERTGSQRFFDLNFSEIQNDPIDCVRGLYAWLGRTLTPPVETGMREWLKDNLREKYGQHDYRPEDFGLTAQGLRKQFRFYTERFNTPVE